MLHAISDPVIAVVISACMEGYSYVVICNQTYKAIAANV